MSERSREEGCLIAYFDLGARLAERAGMSLTKLAPLFVAAALLAPSRAEARAATAIPILGAFVIVEGGVLIAGTVTGIGSSVHLTQDEPRLGWPIASLVAGGVGIAWGSLLTVVFAQDASEIAPETWAFALTPIAVGVTTLSLGIAGLVRRSRAIRAEVEPEQWTLAPIILEGRDSRAPGLGAVIQFD